MFGYIRHAGFVLITLLICGMFAPRVVHAATPIGVEREVAVVRVTIQQVDGTVLRATQATPWGQVAQFDLGGHDLDLSVTDRSHLAIDYARDGSALAHRSMQTRPRSRTVVYTDHDVKITVQIIPIKTRVHSTPIG